MQHGDEVLVLYTAVLTREALRDAGSPLSEIQLPLAASALVSAAGRVVAAHVHAPEEVSAEDGYETLAYLLVRAAGLG